MLAVNTKNLSYQYPDGTRAVNNLSLSIQEGDKIGSIGPNGSGKSTFLTLLNGIRKATGFLEIFGIELTKQTVHQIKKLVGIIFQNPDDQLFCPTIFEDVSFGIQYGPFPGVPGIEGCRSGGIRKTILLSSKFWGAEAGQYCHCSSHAAATDRHG